MFVVSVDMTDDDDETKARLLWVKSLQRVRTQVWCMGLFGHGLVSQDTGMVHGAVRTWVG